MQLVILLILMVKHMLLYLVRTQITLSVYLQILLKLLKRMETGTLLREQMVL